MAHTPGGLKRFVFVPKLKPVFSAVQHQWPEHLIMRGGTADSGVSSALGSEHYEATSYFIGYLYILPDKYLHTISLMVT